MTDIKVCLFFTLLSKQELSFPFFVEKFIGEVVFQYCAEGLRVIMIMTYRTKVLLFTQISIRQTIRSRCEKSFDIINID